MKPYKVHALLKRVPALKAGDTRVLANGKPFEKDFRVVSDDLFSDGLRAFEEVLSENEALKAELERVKVHKDVFRKAARKAKTELDKKETDNTLLILANSNLKDNLATAKTENERLREFVKDFIEASSPAMLLALDEQAQELLKQKGYIKTQ